MNFSHWLSLVGLGLAVGMLFTPFTATPNPSHAKLTALKTGESVLERAMPAVDVRFAEDSNEVPDFQRHVGPLLGRLGCNGRSCHGSFQGQGGLQLSLFGYDFEKDHQALSAGGTYRVDLEDPEDSLILTKPTDPEDHGGGQRFAEDSWQYRLIKNWIAGGAKDFKSNVRLSELKVLPSDILSQPEQVDQLSVIALWNDGTEEDVTPLSRFQSNNPQVASIDENGKVVGGDRGDTHLIVFYDNAVISVPVISSLNHSPVKPKMPFANPTAIDQLVMDKLDRLGIQPSPTVGDLAFLRRVSLDIAGTLPSPQEIRGFLADTSPDKRAQKIDELLETDAYAAWWTTFLGDMTGNSSRQLANVAYGDMAAKGWYQWLHERVKENVPYDEIVRGIVLSNSRTDEETLEEYSTRMSADFQEGKADRFADSPGMPYYWMRREFQTSDTLAISFAHSFLGVRIQCAQCHKHPFDQWTQSDFKQFARFFSGVSVKQPQRAATGEKEALEAIFEKLEIDPSKVRGGNLRRQLSQKARQGEVVPFAELNVGPPRKSREELKAEQESMKQAMEQKQSQMQADPDDEMMGGNATTKTDPKPDAKNRKKLTRAQRRELQRKQQAKRRAQQKRNRYYSDAILLGGDGVALSDFADARVPAMNWLAHEENPYFAKAIVNRVWARYFGLGIVEPADDLNLANPPSNGPLLEYLADGFVENGYDLKWLHREITNSHIYQLSWETNETNEHDRRNFSHAIPRRLAAEVVYDAITMATSNDEKAASFQNQLDARAIAIPGTVSQQNRRRGGNTMNFAMKLFGKSTRDSSCDCDRSAQTSLVQSVFMKNDRHIFEQIRHQDGWLENLTAGGGDSEKAKAESKELARAKAKLKNQQKAFRKARNNGNSKELERLKRRIKSVETRISTIQKAILKKKQESQDKLVIDEVITEAWLRTVSRFPTEAERARCRTYFESDPDKRNALTGMMWALLNTKEFIVNH